MKITIIGAGTVGSSLGKMALEAGHNVLLVDLPGTVPARLAELQDAFGDRVAQAEVGEATGQADIVVLSAYLSTLDEIPAAALDGKVTLDVMNYYPERDGDIPELKSDTLSSTEWVGQHFPGARIVKGFNAVTPETMVNKSLPSGDVKERLVIWLAGDDVEAKKAVAGLTLDLGFAPVDAGTLAASRAFMARGSCIYGLWVSVSGIEYQAGHESTAAQYLDPSQITTLVLP
jgi:8-hydroxy-5-deazaflavin:NADPH oxidoreductase